MTSLPPQSYYPERTEYEKPVGDSIPELTELEQLFRAALSVQGAVDDTDGANDVDETIEDITDYVVQKEREHINSLSVDVETPPSKCSRVVTERVSELLSEFDELKQDIKSERLSEVTSIHDSLLNSKRQIYAMRTDNVERIFKTMKFVDLPLTSFAGKTIVFTGGIDGFSRDELKDIVEQNGGNATGSVSSNTDYLVIGKNPGNNKQADAKKHNTEEISGKTFLQVKEVIDNTGNDDTVIRSLRDDMEVEGFDTPVTVFGLEETNTETGEKELYPFIPWNGVMTCVKDTTRDNKKTLCTHEIYALQKFANDEFTVVGETLPQRLKRLVHPDAYNMLTTDIL